MSKSGADILNKVFLFDKAAYPRRDHVLVRVGFE